MTVSITTSCGGTAVVIIKRALPEDCDSKSRFKVAGWLGELPSVTVTLGALEGGRVVVVVEVVVVVGVTVILSLNSEVLLPASVAVAAKAVALVTPLTT